MRGLTVVVYLLFGSLALLAGLIAVVSPAIFVPAELISSYAKHLVQEQGAGFVFIGLMFLWCVRNFERRAPVHLGLLIFTALMAGIHWAGYIAFPRSIVSPVANTIPFVLLLLTLPRRSAASPTA